MAHPIRKTALAALTFELTSGATEIQLLPDGEFRASDGSGRPAEVDAWRIDADIARQLLATMAAKPNKILIDYEHQTLYKEENGQPAPAAGWFAGAALEYRPGKGIFATNPEWTPRASEYIAGQEYKYISPIISYDQLTGAVVDIRMSALTNNPGLTGMAEVALTALNDFSTKEESSVNETLKKLLAALGLSEGASEDEAISAVGDLVAKVADGKAAAAALTAQNTDSKAQEAMLAMQGQIAALTATINNGKVEKIVSDAIVAGKLLPDQKDWALDLGEANIASLTAFIEKAPAIAALRGMQTEGKAPDGVNQRDAALTATEEKTISLLGMTKEAYLAAR